MFYNIHFLGQFELVCPGWGDIIPFVGGEKGGDIKEGKKRKRKKENGGESKEKTK